MSPGSEHCHWVTEVEGESVVCDYWGIGLLFPGPLCGRDGVRIRSWMKPLAAAASAAGSAAAGSGESAAGSGESATGSCGALTCPLGSNAAPLRRAPANDFRADCPSPATTSGCRPPASSLVLSIMSAHEAARCDACITCGASIRTGTRTRGAGNAGSEILGSDPCRGAWRGGFHPGAAI